MSSHFKDHIQILVDLRCLELGIAPLSDSFDNFEGMCPKQARVCKRKFRKLKRKISREIGHPVGRKKINSYMRTLEWKKYFESCM